MYLDYAETQARRRRTMTMAQWAERLDAFLQFNERELLTHAGTVRTDVARALAEDRTSSTTRGGGRSTPRRRTRRTCGACGSSSTGPTRRRTMEAVGMSAPPAAREDEEVQPWTDC